MAKEEKNNLEQEFKGRNLEDSISLAEHVLKLPRTQLNYEIVAEKTKLFGIKSKEIVIRAWPKKAAADESPAASFMEKLLKAIPLDIRFHTKKKNGMLFFIFEGPDKHMLLRRDGQLLMAFQHLLNKISSQKVQTDCDFFRQKKEKELKEYAQKIAQKVQASGEKRIMELMNPYERRIVHVAVNQIPGITTESLGEGFLKKVKIFPVK